MKHTLTLIALASFPSITTARAAEPISRDEVRAVVAEMLADAQTRSTLEGNSATAGYDKKFFIASADGAFRLNFSGSSILRYTLNIRDSRNEDTAGGYPSGGDDFNPGFSVRRAILRFDGNIINPSLLYNVRIGLESSFISGQKITVTDSQNPDVAPFTVSKTSSPDVRLRFDDIFFTYKFSGDFKGAYLKWGQFKVPFLREELVSEFLALVAERGIVNGYFTQDRSQGAALGFESESWWLEGAISDGIRTKNTPFGTTFNNTNDIALTGRAEYIITGTREQLRDFTCAKDQPTAAQVGAAVHWQHQNNAPSVTSPDRAVGSPANRSILGATFDVQVESGGFSAFVAGVLGYTRARNVVLDASGATESRTFSDFGLAAQVSWRALEHDDLFVRYDGLFLDEDRNLSDRDNFHFLTFGVTHFFAGHAAQFTVDAIISLNHTVGLTKSTAGWLGGSAINLNSSEATGLLGTSRGTEAAVRMQMQIMF